MPSFAWANAWVIEPRHEGPAVQRDDIQRRVRLCLTPSSAHYKGPPLCSIAARAGDTNPVLVRRFATRVLDGLECRPVVGDDIPVVVDAIDPRFDGVDAAGWAGRTRRAALAIRARRTIPAVDTIPAWRSWFAFLTWRSRLARRALFSWVSIPARFTWIARSAILPGRTAFAICAIPAVSTWEARVAVFQ